MLNEVLLPAAVLGSMGAIFGLVLGIAAIMFHVDKDPRIAEVREVLPGANCGGCGQPGCDALAEAMVNGTLPPNACPVGGSAVAAMVAEILGLDAGETVRKVASVKCKGTSETCTYNFEYYGIKDCKEAALVQGGNKTCAFGCLGYGSCVTACQFDAISVSSDGVAIVDPDLCTSCGACVKACPKNVIELVPYGKDTQILCNSNDKGRVVRDACKVGCITCGLCAKNCAQEAITIDEEKNLPIIDFDKCIECGVCAEKCPQKTIKSIVKVS